MARTRPEDANLPPRHTLSLTTDRARAVGLEWPTARGDGCRQAPRDSVHVIK